MEHAAIITSDSVSKVRAERDLFYGEGNEV